MREEKKDKRKIKEEDEVLNKIKQEVQDLKVWGNI